MTLDVAYTLYLILASTPEIPKDQIKRFVQKWFVLSTLTSRYTASPESQMHRDMQSIDEKGFLNFFAEIEASALSVNHVTDLDERIAHLLYRTKKPVILAVNKADNPEQRSDIYDFYSLGLGDPIPVSSSHGTGIGDLLDQIVNDFPE